MCVSIGGMISINYRFDQLNNEYKLIYMNDPMNVCIISKALNVEEAR